MNENEELFTYDIELQENIKVSIEYQHEKDDFAVILIPVKNSKHFTMRYDQVVLGLNIISYGFLNGGLNNKTIKVDYRVMKGHVSRIDSNHPQHRGTQIIETSFPSLSGFSGAPIFCEHTLDLVGMLFGNVESSIEVFSFKDFSEDGREIIKESVNRIVELGLAHTTDALVGYLKEFKSKSIG